MNAGSWKEGVSSLDRFVLAKDEMKKKDLDWTDQVLATWGRKTPGCDARGRSRTLSAAVGGHLVFSLPRPLPLLFATTKDLVISSASVGRGFQPLVNDVGRVGDEPLFASPTDK